MWQYKKSASFSRAVVGPDGTLYFASTRPLSIGPPPAPSIPPLFAEPYYAEPSPVLHALNPDRTQRWQYVLPPSEPQELPSVTVGTNGIVDVAVNTTQIMAFSAAGHLLSSVTATEAGSIDPEFTLDAANRLYVLSKMDHGAELRQYDAGLHELWRYSWTVDTAHQYPTAPPLIAGDGALYMAGPQTVTGQPGGGFSYLQPGMKYYRPALAPGGRVYVASFEQSVFADSGLGYFEHGVFTALDLAQRHLRSDLLLDAAGQVYCIVEDEYHDYYLCCYAADGLARWTLPVASAGARELSMGHDGTLYLMAGGTLYAVGAP